MNKLVTVLVLLMAMLNLVPPMFKDNEVLFDNVYFSIQYLLLSYLGLVIPFLFTTLNKHISRISLLFGAWFLCGLAFELINFAMPDIVLNSTNGLLFSKFVMMFVIAMGLIVSFEAWKQKRLQN